jgi:hypothetical protein
LLFLANLSIPKYLMKLRDGKGKGVLGDRRRGIVLERGE